MAMKPQGNTARNWGAHIGMALVALVISAGLWVYAVVVNDPDNSTDMDNIQVTYVNEGVFKARSLIVTGSRGRVNITLHGRMSDLVSLRREDVTVTVDLSQIEEPGRHELYYEVELPSALGGRTVSWAPKTAFVEVTADLLDTRAFEVRLMGEEVRAERDYLIRKEELSPAAVSVTGPVSVLDGIRYAGVEMPRTSPLSSTQDYTLPVKLYDAQDRAVVSEHLTLDDAEVTALFTVLMEKTVRVSLQFKEGGGLTERDNITCTYEPESVIVAGDPERLSAVHSLELGLIHLADLLESERREYTISELHLPNGIELISAVEVFAVDILIHDVETVQRNVAPYAIGYEPPAGYRLVIHTETLLVSLRGLPEALEAVTASNLRAVIDLSGVTLPVEEKKYFGVGIEIPDSVAVGVIPPEGGRTYEAVVELVLIEEVDD